MVSRERLRLTGRDLEIMAILYVASEAAELKPFADHLTGLRKLKWPLDYAWEGIWEGRRMLLAANGAGPKLAAHVVEIAIRAAMAAELSSSKLEAVVSTGYCGALDPALNESQIVVATRVISLASGEAFDCTEISAESEFVSGSIASQDRVANDSFEKTRLFGEGSVAVEMEAAGVAARTKRAGLPFCCIKVVSDRADESFPFDLNLMRSPEGRIARGKIGVHALTHPKAISSLLRLRRRSESAAKVLGEFLVSSRVIANAASLQPES
jgi:adenosylhomocysteine nucleosidase